MLMFEFMQTVSSTSFMSDVPIGITKYSHRSTRSKCVCTVLLSTDM